MGRAGQAMKAAAALGVHDIVKPSDCTLLVGIPTTADEFERAVVDTRAGRRDFACAGRLGGWAGYRVEVVGPFEAARRQWGRYGARVIEQATRESLRQCLQDKGAGVTIVLTHFAGDSIELCDGMLGIDAMAAMLPPDHAGILDLCMCHPMALVAHLKRAAPAVSVCFASAALTPARWFAYYARLFRLLQRHDLNYVDASEACCMNEAD